MTKSTTQKSPTRNLFTWLTAGMLVAFCSFSSMAQVTVSGGTTATGGSPYGTLSAAIAAINAGGALTGAVTVDVAAGFTETLTGPIALTMTGTVTNTITIQRTGAGLNPLLTAYVGTSTPGSAAHDDMFRLVGADYVTIDAIDLFDPNTTNPATMEGGYVLYKSSLSDGAQNNTIKNCTIFLSIANNASGSGPSVEGSRGIEITNATPAAATTALTPTTAAGTNSNNLIYSNTIRQCNYGVVLSGFAASSPFTAGDTGNDVGGSSAATGNSILNFGGATGATNPAAGIRANNQWSCNLSYNTLNSNNGAGANHVSTLRGIYGQAGTSSSVTINNNNITVKSGATTSASTAIENSIGATAAGNTVNINNNTITGCTYTTATSGVFTAITNTASAATVNITGNQVTSNSTAATSGTHVLVVNSGAATVAVNINTNNVNGWSYTAAAHSGSLNFINNTGGASGCTVSMNGNNMQGLSAAGTVSGAHVYIRNTATSPNTNMNSNTFTNLTDVTTSSVIFISNNVTHAASTTHNVNSNSIVTAFNKTGVGAVTNFFYDSFGTSTTTVTEINIGNNFSNATFAGTNILGGWRSADGTTSSPLGSRKTITGNTFSNITMGTGAISSVMYTGYSDNTYANTNLSGNTISNINSQGTIIGYLSDGGNQNFFNNTITGITTTGTSIQAIRFTGGVVQNVYKNKICDLQASNAAASVYGVVITVGTTFNIYNNLIGDLRTPLTNAPATTINIAGILSSSTTTSSSINVSYNTIYINATSSGAIFSTCGIFHTASATATTATLNMRNNIIVNTSTPNGGGYTVAYVRTSTAFGNYGAVSDRNLFYAGTPGPNNLIYTDITNLSQTLAAYQGIAGLAPRDANSKTENPTFLSTACNNANFLHVDPTVATQISDGGINIAGITDDYDGNTRQGNGGYAGTGTAPDMGADEFEPVLANCVTAVGGTATLVGSPTICGSGSRSITNAGFSTGTGSTYEWEKSNDNFVSNIVGTGVLTPAAYSTGSISSTTYYRLRVQCATNTSIDYSNIITITVYPAQVTTINPTSATICSGTSQTLTENSGTATSWLWSTSAVTQAVSVSPTSNTTYTVTATDANGCSSSASATVTVNAAPSTPTVTPNSPNTLCLGASQPLTASSTPSGTSVLLSEGFESGAPGWAFQDSSTTGVNLPQQLWHIQAAPYSDPSGSITFSNFSVTGSGFAYTNADAGGSGSFTRTFMVSPSFSTVGYSGTGTLGFKMCYKFWGSSSPAEQVMIQISTDGGTTWAATLANYSPTNTGPDVGTTTNLSEVAVPVTVNIPAIYMGQPNVKIRWRYISNWGYVWIVDDVSLTATPTVNYAWTSAAGSGLPGGAGTPSPSNSSISATPTVAGAYTYTVTASVGSCTATSSSALVTVNQAPTISACPGDITQCDNHIATWTDPTATGTPTPTVVCVPASGSTFATGTTLVTCTATNSCGTDDCSFNVTINETPVIAACPSDITQCDNHVATWTDPTATGTPAATVVCVPASGSTFATGTTLVTCTATNSCGTDDCSFNVTINESATAPTSVTTDDGDNEICTSGTITLTANGGTLGSPAGTYTWYEGGCGTGSIIGTGTTLVRGPGLSVGTHVYYVRINQAACGNTTCASVSVVVTGAPPATNVPFPTVPAYACSGNNLPASTSPVTYATTYTWDGPVGTTFNSVSNPYASGSTSVTVNYGAPNGSGYNICVQGSNACGTTTRRCSFVRGTVNVPGTITAANNRTIECPSTSAGYSIAAVGGATSYTWSITGNATVIGTGTSATVNFGAGWTSGTLSVTANTPCYSSAPRSLALSNVTALPGAISGPASVCPGGPAQVYSVPAVAGAATYNWVLPANATGGSSTNSISVTFLTGYTFGDIKVSITSICGNTSAQQAKTVTTGIPGVPASVSGNASGLCNQTTVYSCPSVTGASSYTWSVSGGSINSGQGSTSINVTFGAFVNGNVCVTANNACGSSAPRCLPVIAKPAISGNITYTPGTICANDAGVDFQINPVYGTSGYNWIFPSGVSVVLDLGNEQIVNWGSNSGVVSVTAANACGSATKTTTITLTCREAATETIESNSSVSVYPNPAHDRINVQINATEKTNYVLNLMDLSGRVMSTANATAQKGMNTSELDLSTLAKGVYMIEVKSDLINKQIRVVVE